MNAKVSQHPKSKSYWYSDLFKMIKTASHHMIKRICLKVSSVFTIVLCLFCVSLPLPTVHAQSDAVVQQDPLYQQAKAKYQQRSQSATVHEAAFHLWSTLATKYPKNLESQIWCARTAYYGGHRVRDTNTKMMKRIFKRGLKCRTRLLKFHAQNPYAQIWSILIHFKHKMADSFIPPLSTIEKIVKKLEAMVQKKVKSHMPFMLLGALYRELPGWPVSIGDEKKSLRYLKQGQKYAQLNAEYLLELAATYHALDQDELARKTYKTCITKGTGHPDLQWEAQDARQWAKHMLSQLD